MVVTINFFKPWLVEPRRSQVHTSKNLRSKGSNKDGVVFPRVTWESKSAHVEIHANPCLLGLFGLVRRTKNRKKLAGCWWYLQKNTLFFVIYVSSGTTRHVAGKMKMPTPTLFPKQTTVFSSQITSGFGFATEDGRNPAPVEILT